MKKMRNTLYVFALVVLTGCSGRYVGLPSEQVLRYQTTPTYGNLYTLATAYAQTINDALRADTLHPGMYADYGVALALLGHEKEACYMLNTEMAAFPESKGTVERIKKKLLPVMQYNDYVPPRDTIDMQQLSAWALVPNEAARFIPNAASIIDSTDTARIRQQNPVDSIQMPIKLTANQKREKLAYEQAEAERQKQARIDSIADVKKAQAAEKKKAKAQRKEAAKAKEKAKKEANKEKIRIVEEREKKREEEKQQRAAQQNEAKKQRAAEQEAQKKQREAERELQKQQRAAEQEALKKQREAERELQKQQRAAEQEAQKKQREAERELQKQQRAAEQEALRQQREAEKATAVDSTQTNQQ